MDFNSTFYNGKKILITGHTGFKGAWMSRLLVLSGADVTGIALPPPSNPNLFDICHIADDMKSIIADVRDLKCMQKIFSDIQPDIVIHMAAQPLVRESYKNPVYTYDVNVMGTVNILECIRNCHWVKSFVNVTTDKVYLNREWEWGYREIDELNGYDPYSNSKSCSELVTSSYQKSFFQDRNIAVSTCRAGNVIGGGDFADNRIIPDCIRAAMRGDDIVVRNPFSVRPYQHVLEPVVAYLIIAERQYNDSSMAGNYNIGPNDMDCRTTRELVELFCQKWEEATSNKVRWIDKYDGGPHEANFLKLDTSKIRQVFGWQPTWNLEKTMDMIVEWSICYMHAGDIRKCMDKQIKEFL